MSAGFIFSCAPATRSATRDWLPRANNLLTHILGGMRWSSETPYLSQTAVRLEGSLKTGPTSSVEELATDVLQLVNALTTLASTLALQVSLSADGISGVIDEGRLDASVQGLVDEMSAVGKRPSDGEAVWSQHKRPRLPRAGLAEYRRRWTTELAEEALATCLVENCGPAPFGVAGGRVDLRGFPFTTDLLDPYVVAARRAKRRSPFQDLVAVDLTYADVALGPMGELFGVALQDCVLDFVDFGDTFVAGQFEHCSLRGSKVSILRASFYACDLEASRLHLGSNFQTDEILVGCNFSGVSFARTGFHGQTFVNCVFDAADFTKAELMDAAFYGCSFNGASFEQTFYATTSFVDCVGLEVDRMNRRARSLQGAVLHEPGDLIVLEG